MVDIVDGRDPLEVADTEESSTEESAVEQPDGPSGSNENQGRAPDMRDANPQPGLD